MAGDVFHPTTVGDQTLLCQHVIKVDGIELCEAILLGDVDLKGWKIQSDHFHTINT